MDAHPRTSSVNGAKGAIPHVCGHPAPGRNALLLLQGAVRAFQVDGMSKGGTRPNRKELQQRQKIPTHYLQVRWQGYHIQDTFTPICKLICKFRDAFLRSGLRLFRKPRSRLEGKDNSFRESSQLFHSVISFMYACPVG